MKQRISIIIYLIISILSTLHAQDSISNVSPISIDFSLGYDIPTYSNEFHYYKVKPGITAGIGLNYFIKNFGIGLDYDYFLNGSSSNLNDFIYNDTLLVANSPKTDLTEGITRHFLSLGPSYRFSILDRSIFELYVRAGYSFISGGELITTSNLTGSTTQDHHVLFSGLESSGLSGKTGFRLKLKAGNNLSISLGGYVMRHFSVHNDDTFELNNQGNLGIYYGHSDLGEINGENIIGSGSAYILPIESSDEKPPCAVYQSFGGNLGLSYSFGSRSTKQEEVCTICNCPNDGHKVVVTVRDKLSGKVIPNADIAIKKGNNIIATGATNSFGAVDFGEIPHGTYIIYGTIYNIATTSSTIEELEFQPDAIIQKEIFYDGLRFILKGKVTNMTTRLPEPQVVVNLTNTKTKSINQETSQGKGEFGFQLDKDSSYEIVGVKENKLSDIKKASTIGLNRSTTLFVDLELGVEDFECDRGTVLDIKYEYDKDALLTQSKFELDRLIRYMTDHNGSMVELSSHTDSRGSNEYNQDLSQRRAQSAVRYIMSKGITQTRISARGYGETRLRNNCIDGVKCSDAEHRINRRTEAKLLCN